VKSATQAGLWSVELFPFRGLRSACPSESLRFRFQYYTVEDMHAHRSISNTDHRWRSSGQCWGSVQAFLKLPWEGETLRLAVIETNRVTHFLPEIPRNALDYCPMVLERNTARPLQIIDTRAVTSVAARIKLSGRPTQTEIIYETSLDLLRPDMTFTSQQ
jgi:hypothetical protein